MILPSVEDLPVEGKKVLLRTNFDVPLIGQESGRVKEWKIADETRIREALPTIKYLLGQQAKIIIVSHLGRPEGKVVPELSLRPIAEKLGEFLGRVDQEIVILENLRFNPGEEANDENFAKKLALLADFYVNEAFACSHRPHASIVGVPKFLPPPPAGGRALGFEFLKEIEVLTRVRENPARPVVLILGGVKEDKIAAAKKLVSWADWILLGGKLVEYDGAPELLDHHKVVGQLIKKDQDITMETVAEFKEIIEKAKTIIWAGPMGNFYDEKYATGTKVIAQAVAESKAFTVVGGGDTEVALTKFGLTSKINFISSGGGAMLEFLAAGTLPGIEAITGTV